MSAITTDEIPSFYRSRSRPKLKSQGQLQSSEEAMGSQHLDADVEDRTFAIDNDDEEEEEEISPTSQTANRVTFRVWPPTEEAPCSPVETDIVESPIDGDGRSDVDISDSRGQSALSNLSHGSEPYPPPSSEDSFTVVQHFSTVARQNAEGRRHGRGGKVVRKDYAYLGPTHYPGGYHGGIGSGGPSGIQTEATSTDHSHSHAHTLLNNIHNDMARRHPAGSAYATSQLYLLYQNVGPEADDDLHSPDEKDDRRSHRCPSFSNCVDGLSLIVLAASLSMLLCGYPVVSWILHTRRPSPSIGFGLGGTNGTGQVPVFPSSLRQSIDPETPQEGLNWIHPGTGDNHHLVFSDEFNAEGRTFWEGDDPFWTAVDIWYGVTGDVEWYSPEAVNTTDGYLQITMEEKINHELWFRSGMVQSWNKFCFQGGYIEIAAILPGGPATEGWWPGLWTIGNLGRPGYAATTDGLWPYSYNQCDTGILPNQTFLNGSGPYNPLTRKKPFSYLPGMRASSCTCPGEDHPGPTNSIGRGAPELDLLEAQTSRGVGWASQSLQVAPFDKDWHWNESQAIFSDALRTHFNPYTGGKYQESVSVLTTIPDDGYELSLAPRAIKYGVHYEPDWDGSGKGEVTWFIDGQISWRVPASAFGPVPGMDIGQRLIPVEPMSIAMNLGMSNNFQHIVYPTLQFPAKLRIDYVRVYQPDGQEDRISCDPPDHPTADYIRRHPALYHNPNLTVWPKDIYGSWPKNKLMGC